FQRPHIFVVEVVHGNVLLLEMSDGIEDRSFAATPANEREGGAGFGSVDLWFGERFGNSLLFSQTLGDHLVAFFTVFREHAVFPVLVAVGEVESGGGARIPALGYS